ncbi:GAF domain-containing protein [Rhodococcus sovatensis]|uniref:GAF domain-containing protein n=1 Tax=Rhodococcus sovatensis TaxID=1805840 RepID=A0ABZ2PFI0_9NOCA
MNSRPVRVQAQDDPVPRWMLVETVHRGRASLVSLGGRSRDMSSLPRAIKAVVGGRSSTRVWAEVVRSLEHVRASAQSLDTTVPTGTRRTRILLHPVVGRGAQVHGVHLWVGDSEFDPPGYPMYDALAVTFEAERRSFVADPELLQRVVGDASIGGRSNFTSPEVFRYVDVDDAMGAIGALLSPAPEAGLTWSGLATAPFLARGPRLHLVFTATGEQSSWLGLVHAVESDSVATPRLESAAFTALGEVSPQVALVLMDITHNRLIRWLTDPVPSIQWKGIVDDRDTPHPDDVKRIFAAASGLFAGTHTSGSVDGIRLRRIGGGWTVVDARGALLPREKGGPGLMLVQLVVVGTSDDPDPVPVGDSGHPSLLD